MKSDAESIELNEMPNRAPLLQLPQLELHLKDLPALNFNIADLSRTAHDRANYRLNTIPRNDNSTFSKLAQPLLIVMFQYLTVADLVRCSEVCNEWRSLIKVNEVW